MAHSNWTGGVLLTSVTQRLTQYNKEIGQPRGRLINPKPMKATQLDDGLGMLDHKLENVHASVIGMAVDYLSRLAGYHLAVHDDAMPAAREVFRASLLEAQRLSDSDVHPSAKEDAARALLSLNVFEHENGTATFAIDDDAVRIACQLATYDVTLRAGPPGTTPKAPCMCQMTRRLPAS